MRRRSLFPLVAATVASATLLLPVAVDARVPLDHPSRIDGVEEPQRIVQDEVVLDELEPTPVDPGPVDPGPVDPGPIDPGPVDPGPVDPGPVDPGPVDPGPVDPGPVDPGPPTPNPPPAVPCEGHQGSIKELFFPPGSQNDVLDLELTEICVDNLVLRPDGSMAADLTARLIGPNLDVRVTGPASYGGDTIIDVDLRGNGTYVAANATVQGAIRLQVRTGLIDLSVSGALVTGTTLLTADVVGTVIRTTTGQFSLDLRGNVTYQKGNLRVTGTITDTYLTGHTPGPHDLPTEVDPSSIWGHMRVKGTATWGKVSGSFDALLKRESSTAPYAIDLVLRNVTVAKGITLDRLNLGNTANGPDTITIDGQLTVPKLMFEDLVLGVRGSANISSGTFELNLSHHDASSPWLGLFWRWSQSAEVRIIGSPSSLTLRARVSLGAAVPIAASYAGGDGMLVATIDHATGNVSGAVDIVGSACVILCALAHASGAVHIDLSGNLPDGRLNVQGGGAAGGQALFGFAYGSGYARVDATLDVTGPDLRFTGTAFYAIEASTWWGLTRNVDDWMDLRFDTDRVTVVDGQWRRKREKVVNMRGEVYPVRRTCGDRYTKKWIDLNGWDYEGTSGDCDASGNVNVGTVSGTLLVDADRSGSASPGDTPLAGERLLVKRSDGTVVGLGRTTADGSFSIRATGGSGLRIEPEVMPAGHATASSWPSSFSVSSGGTTSLSGTLLRVLSFGTATGTAYHDLDDDGVQDPGEPPVAGATVTVTPSWGGGAARSTSTDDQGRWTIGGLDDRYSYEARYQGGSGFWVRDDPYSVDEDRTWFSVTGGSTAREVGAVAMVNTEGTLPGGRIEGYVSYQSSCNGAGYVGYQQPSYGLDPYGSGSCDPYGNPGYPSYPTYGTGEDEVMISLSTGHISRVEAWSNRFTMRGVPVGTHQYWIHSSYGYAQGTVKVNHDGETVWLYPQITR